MAIYLPESDITILEMPRTGTTWLRHVLKQTGTTHEILSPNIDCCPRHSPGWCYEVKGKLVSTIRNPVTWLESMWRFHRPAYSLPKQHGDSPMKAGRFYAHGHFAFACESFGEWVSQILPPDVEEYLAMFCEGVEAFIWTEDIERDASTFIDRTPDQLRCFALQNVSRKAHADWPFEPYHIKHRNTPRLSDET